MNAFLQDAAVDIVCPLVQEPFEAVGLAFDDFRQVTDQSIERILQAFRSGADAGESAITAAHPGQ